MTTLKCSQANCPNLATKRIVSPYSGQMWRDGVVMCDECAAPFERALLPLPENGTPALGCAYVEKLQESTGI